MQRIAEVIKRIKTDFAKPMRAENLAGKASLRLLLLLSTISKKHINAHSISKQCQHY
jgi:hypothetical protein